MSQKKMHEIHRINFVVLLSYSMLTLILLFAYIMELVKGSRTPEYTAVFAILDLLPYIVCMVLYRKDRQSGIIKYVLALGFSILYAFVLLTAAVPTTFVYMFLVFFMIIPYGDLKLCYIAGGIAFIANVISVLIGFTNGLLSSADLALVEIQVISIALAALFSAFVTLVIRRVNVQKLEELNVEKEKVDTLLTNTLEISRGISEDIDSVKVRMERLDLSVAATRDSMHDVSAGANETAESMQNQLLQTEEIMEQVKKAKEVSRVIAEDIQQTEDTVNVGKGNINNLLSCVNRSEEASTTLVAKMNELTENTEKMNTIVEMINSVTKQTSLLSLNASIEAARAGEAGRGFAVVAEEISSLAKQTSEATVSITSLIEGITVSIDEVLNSINLLMESNTEQNQSVETMALNFEKIERCSRSIFEVSDGLEDVIDELAKSNEMIVQSINSVSSVTEEVSARANETLSESERDALVVDEITKVIIELHDKAKQLNQ
ncbi:MAG: hypothetical protein IJ324_04550 [Lachnospiraceae bacterium]|nr:hypothetical protein [Lachnospiraceae bacterium]